MEECPRSSALPWGRSHLRLVGQNMKIPVKLAITPVPNFQSSFSLAYLAIMII
jgi:hypothetical protein